MMWYTRPVAEAAILDPHPGLMGWWRFDEESGFIAKDSSGNGNDGTVYATWVAGKYGQALGFDGIDDYAFASNIKTDYITIQAWVNRTVVGANRHVVGNGVSGFLGSRTWDFSLTSSNRVF